MVNVHWYFPDLPNLSGSPAARSKSPSCCHATGGGALALHKVGAKLKLGGRSGSGGLIAPHLAKHEVDTGIPI